MPDQFIPDDFFSDGPTEYGSHPDLYLSILPWESSPEATTGFSLKVADGTLFDGHQFFAGSPRGRAVFVKRGTPQLDDFACYCVGRQLVTGDVDVVAVPSVVFISGSGDNETFRHFGVCSHVTGGTVETPTGTFDEYHKNVSGYFFIETKNASGRHQLLLLEVSSGSITVLASQDVEAIDPEHTAGTAADYFAPRRLRLNVEPDGFGGVTIRCYRRATSFVRTSPIYLPTAGGFIGTAPELVCFGGPITRGVALADGRCGFGAQVFRDTPSGGSRAGVAVDTFWVATSDGATLQFCDNFFRAQRRASRLLSDGIRAGHALSSAWIGDGKSRAASGGINSFGLLDRGTAVADEIEGGKDEGDSQSWPGFHLRQVPERLAAQHKRAEFRRINAATGEPVEMGLLLRFTAQAFPSGNFDSRGRFNANSNRADYYKRGYIVLVRHDAAATPVWRLLVRYCNGSQDFNEESLVIATANLAAVGLSVGTPFTLSAELVSLDTSSGGTTGITASLLIKINGSTITPVIEPGVSGVVVEDGYIYDIRSGIPDEAGTSGIYINPDDLQGSNLVAVLKFESLALTEQPNLDPSEQPTVEIAGEADTATGTFAFELDAVYSEEVMVEPTRHYFEGGSIQTITRATRPRRVWSNLSVTLTAEQRLAFEAFVSEHRFGEIPFNWVNPMSGEPVVVSFDGEGVEYETLFAAPGRSYTRARFSFIERFAISTLNP